MISVPTKNTEITREVKKITVGVTTVKTPRDHISRRM